jgi:hypothetical protein
VGIKSEPFHLNQRHIMWCLILFFFSSSLHTQEISKRLNFAENHGDFICSIASIDSVLYFQHGNFFDTSCTELIGHASIGLFDLNTGVRNNFTSDLCDSSSIFYYSSNSNCFDKKDTDLVALYSDGETNGFGVFVHNVFSDSLVQFQYDGLVENRTPISFAIKLFNNKVYLLLSSSDGSSYLNELWVLDENYEIEQKKMLSDQRMSRMNLSITKDSTLLIILSKSKSSRERELILNEYDLDLNLLESFIYDENVNEYTAPNAYKTEDDGYICSWAVDYESRFDKPFFFDTFPYPPAVTKFDSSFNVKWEYFFIERTMTQTLSFTDVGNGKYLGAGGNTEFIDFDTLIPALGDAPGGYAFLITEEGEVEWRRYITDLRSNSPFGFFWDGCAIPGGYAFGGIIDTTKEVGDPFINDPASWIVTLDSNGCWNGNCNDHIIVINDDSSTTIDIDTMTTAVPQQPTPDQAEIKAYPNPSSGVVNVEFDQAAVRSLHIMSSDGKLLREIQTRGSKAILHIGGYPPGLYLIYVYDQNDKLEGVQKIILI